MRVRFWGVRGSTPTPQIENMGIGGNTACTEIRTDSDQILIFDGGTGIRLLGKELEREFGNRPMRAHIFFSHFHLDHIQGIPFFRPLYNPNNHFTFYFAGRRDANLVLDALSGMMANPYFPVDMSKLPCSREYVDLAEGAFQAAEANILVLPLNHPQGCVGYRIEQNGKAISYCTDVEHGPAGHAPDGEAVEQPARRLRRPRAPERREILAGVALPELVGRAGAAGIATRAPAASQARTSWRMNFT